MPPRNSSAAISVALTRLRSWWSRRQMRRALEELDDATLRDIGLYRGEIPAMVDALSGPWAGRLAPGQDFGLIVERHAWGRA